MLYFEESGENISISDTELIDGLIEALSKFAPKKSTKKVLAVPPDFTRFNSRAGILTAGAQKYYGSKLTDILPAVGTHHPMSREEIAEMFPGVDASLFRCHDWRRDLCTLGAVPAEYVRKVSGGAAAYEWPAQVNKLLIEGGFDCILSIGQVVPHEVIGFANHSKNIFIGTGGEEGIHKSHFLGAAYGMEKIMGRIETPVRRVLNYAADRFLRNLPVLYVQTVVAPDAAGVLHTRGLFIGDGYECFEKAALLSGKVNITRMKKPLRRVVVYLDPKEYRSTWLGNKAIYRTRTAIADGGELIILAPGLKEFGEDKTIDRLVRKYGYSGTPEVLKSLETSGDLENNLCAAAHLIHGSSEGRFSITYAPGHLRRGDIESAGYEYADLMETADLFQVETKQTGWHQDKKNEEFYYIKNPALGLWVYDEKVLDVTRRKGSGDR